ncbi:hypothetical protein BpHYR1_015092 [Brachionus plicatilis]|uniref:Uncharacterized protein n=1 Tax=Brachionus plicatilis TaxID=10195 RepID=A0A3M7PK74_BRAPC|nr:hypothetical protein BpHYR1_015092 [Brachionus plicatilis]
MNDDNTSQFSSTRRLEWDLIKECTIETKLDEGLLTKIPYNVIRSSHSKTNFYLKNFRIKQIRSNFILFISYEWYFEEVNKTVQINFINGLR